MNSNYLGNGFTFGDGVLRRNKAIVGHFNCPDKAKRAAMKLTPILTNKRGLVAIREAMTVVTEHGGEMGRCGMGREEMIQKLNQRISDPNSVVLIRKMGGWVKIGKPVVDWGSYLSVHDNKDCYFINQIPEDFSMCLADNFKVFDAKLNLEWLGGVAKC